MVRVIAVFAMAGFAASLHAQSDSTRGAVRGTVYDSVRRAPISGASVQMVLASDPAKAAYATESNARGEYFIGGVPAGRYVIGFQHDALDSLALKAPLVALDVRGNDTTAVPLAVPSPATIVAATCRAIPSDSTGLVIGMLRDTRTGAALDTGFVQGSWSELIIDKGGFSQFEHAARATVTKDGWFVLCGVPAMDELALSAGSANDSSGVVAIAVPFNGVVRRDIYIGGTLTVRGTLRSEKDRPIANGRVGVFGRARTAVTDSAGSFVLYDVPAGTQTVEARALGYAATQMPALLRAGGDTSFAFQLTSLKRVMDTIRVVATRLYNRDSYGFERRRRIGGGYFFDEAWIAKRRPFDVFQILQQVPSLRVSYGGSFQRQVTMRGGFTGSCIPSLYVNGAKLPSDLLSDLDMWAPPEEIAGLEVYRSTNTPAQFRDYNSCGAVVLWTHAARRARR